MEGSPIDADKPPISSRKFECPDDDTPDSGVTEETGQIHLEKRKPRITGEENLQGH